MKLLLVLLLFICGAAQAAPKCDKNALNKHPENVLSCYIAMPENSAPLWVIEMDEHNKRGVSIETYKLRSQSWPKAEMSQQGTAWKHRLVIYRPDSIKSHQALLFVNGGTATTINDDDPAPLHLDFARMAIATQSVVVDLQNIPQQYLFLEENKALKEDSLAAYTWSRFLKNPSTNSYWPLQVPMTKAVVKAMDATQQIIAQEDDFEINRFVISGVSKRGWAAWLAALSDDRVAAIVPIAINVLNFDQMLQNLYETYNQHWPDALHDYHAFLVTDKIHQAGFKHLTKIIDPMAYLNCDNCKVYKERLHIPKYIINASNDEFFTPDSLNNYLDKLPGENAVRVLPNQGHAINDKIIENALLSYYETIIYGIQRPQLHWRQNHMTLQKVTADSIPQSAKLWEAENPDTRDFRLGNNIVYQSKNLTPVCVKNHCEYTIDIQKPKKGFKTDFVELTYRFTNGDSFVLTTPAFTIGSSAVAVPVATPVVKNEEVKITPPIFDTKNNKVVTPVKYTFMTAPVKTVIETKQQGKNMSDKKILNDLVDVIALSKKKCERPIRAHLAYATKDNFVGALIDGYTPGLTDLALMSRNAAEALCAVQNDLIKHHNMGLLIYDSYRPKRAVLHFVRWSKEPVPEGADGKHELERKRLQYPDIEKHKMFELGYVSEDSQHCYGSTVDLVLVDSHGKELDHGVSFDYMGTKSHLSATAKDIGAKGFENRKILAEAMQKHGFLTYPYEYWHFSYKDKMFHKPIDIAITPELKGLNADV